MNEQVNVPVPRDRAGEFVVRTAETVGAQACVESGRIPVSCYGAASGLGEVRGLRIPGFRTRPHAPPDRPA